MEGSTKQHDVMEKEFNNYGDMAAFEAATGKSAGSVDPELLKLLAPVLHKYLHDKLFSDKDPAEWLKRPWLKDERAINERNTINNTNCLKCGKKLTNNDSFLQSTCRECIDSTIRKMYATLPAK